VSAAASPDSATGGTAVGRAAGAQAAEIIESAIAARIFIIIVSSGGECRG
jgi:hypothetical protein